MIELALLSPKDIYLGKIRVQPDATIKQIKEEISKECPQLPVNRQSIRLEARGKDQRDTLTAYYLGLHTGSAVYIKDLGPQISWRLVFFLEYLGPLLVYLWMATRPWLFYEDKGDEYPDFSFAAKLGVICWSAHYFKRLMETLFVHRFSHGTMPLRNLFKNCGYYWGFTAYVGYYINHPWYTPPPLLWTCIGLLIFLLCEIGNLSIHLLLRDLRPPGTTIRKMPMPNSNIFTHLYNYVSCPNYTYEVGAWLGFTIMTGCIPAFVFACAGFYQMAIWARAKSRQYHKEFPTYPERYSIVPNYF